MFYGYNPGNYKEEDAEASAEKHRSPSSTEIVNILKIFDEDLDQLDRFYLINCLCSDNFKYIKVLISWASQKQVYHSKDMLTFIFNLTLYYLKLVTLKLTERSEEYLKFISKLGEAIQELFKNLCMTFNDSLELSSFHSLMVYVEYMILVWVFKFPTDYIDSMKGIIKKHEDYKINRLFMVALYLHGGKYEYSLSHNFNMI